MYPRLPNLREIVILLSRAGRMTLTQVGVKGRIFDDFTTQVLKYHNTSLVYMVT